VSLAVHQIYRKGEYYLLSVYPEAGYRASFKGMLLGGGPIAPDKLAQCEAYLLTVVQQSRFSVPHLQISRQQLANTFPSSRKINYCLSILKLATEPALKECY
jgi:hypothetical protein